jgi:CRP-like cAMP-binding protein
VIADEDTIVMEIPKDALHSYLALNPKNAEEALISLSNQISLVMKHIEMINEELMKKQ